MVKNWTHYLPDAVCSNHSPVPPVVLRWRSETNISTSLTVEPASKYVVPTWERFLSLDMWPPLSSFCSVTCTKTPTYIKVYKNRISLIHKKIAIKIQN